MSQKTHPKIIRIRETKDWLSRGFYGKKYPNYLEEDFAVRSFLDKKLKQSSIQIVEIERTSSVMKIIIKTARPALVIGRGGKGVEDLKKAIEKKIFLLRKKQGLPNPDIKIEVFEVKNPWMSAELVSQWVAGQLEKMVPFRRVLKMALRKMMEHKEIQGAKITMAGRLNGAEIARTEWLHEGKLPRQTIRAMIEYGFAEAHCTYGKIGVKVLMYKGDKFS